MSESQVKIEVRGGSGGHNAMATLFKVIPEAEPWDPSRGVVELDMEVEAEGFPRGVKRYRFADPFCVGLDLAGQINLLNRQIKGKKPITVVEPSGRRCGCGRMVSTAFCGSCSEQQYIYSPEEYSCSDNDHQRILGQARFCPLCGRAIGAWQGLGRIG